jgi:hypothetical protein
VQLGLIALHVLVDALSQIGIEIPTVILDEQTFSVLDWTAYAGPQQGFNRLAKPNSDVGCELLRWMKSTTTDFICHDALIERDNDDQEAPVPKALLHLTTKPTPATPILYPPSSQFRLIIDDTEYNFLPEALLKERRTLPAFKQFLQIWCHLPIDKFDDVAWDLVATSINQVCLGRMIPILKFTSNELATGERMLSWFKSSPACPFCGTDEDMKHLFSCNHRDAIAGREKSFTSLSARITKLSPHSGHIWIDLARTAITELGGEFTSTFTHDDSLDDLRAALSHIGWVHLFQGLIHKTIWTELQSGRGTYSGPCIIKALWRYSAMTWRTRNRKKHGATKKERIYNRKQSST